MSYKHYIYTSLTTWAAKSERQAGLFKINSSDLKLEKLSENEKLHKDEGKHMKQEGRVF